MPDPALQAALGSVPAGRWAVGVSGGADSVALLRLLHAARPDVTLRVVHLNHQARGQASDDDAAFVLALADRLHLPATVALLADVLPGVHPQPANLSARYRAGRLALFRQVVAQHRLDGVILAHHRLDQAETVFLRLMRGTGALALGGMQRRSVNDGLTVLRPLLAVDPEALRATLGSLGQAWREDASNASTRYRRNRVRGRLLNDPSLTELLVRLGEASVALERWVTGATGPALPDALPVDALDGLPPIVRQHAARRWLASAGVPADAISAATIDRVLTMMDDAASPAGVDLPNAVRIVRRRRTITATRPTDL